MAEARRARGGDGGRTGTVVRLPIRPRTAPAPRDLRLDFFRGLALWLIYLDHVPGNVLNLATLRNFGFSDAAEIFVFISGYTAALVYGRVMRERGVIIASARVLKRAWTLYVAFIFLFVVYLAQIAYVAQRLKNPLYAEEMNVLRFLDEPDVTLIQALLLRFKPANTDILPLYIVLMAAFPLVLWGLTRRPNLTLVLSAALYTMARLMGWNFAGWPAEHMWVFNPLAWQLLFVFGAWCAMGGLEHLEPIVRSRAAVVAACAFLTASLFVVLSWSVPALEGLVPDSVAEIIYPISKTDLALLRFAHFLALALVVAHFVPMDWSFLRSKLAKPLILCGQHSLEIFCLGVFLSFGAQIVLAEISGRLLTHVLVSVAGIIAMVAFAALMSWYQENEKRRGPDRAAGGT
ncbi:membrane protein [Azorhizobium oxalatiphilum]|uniref:Membrane protein n=1 Tax=Azorhizobium oxalatiphilum TaxID=980631 RepID=A0A917C832_9HYPH|nr:OpgC domain-containing protein [Azorhizobium oxalatiphilum]GGF76884.1 membrane protein [Azorhizobium oxalatiphilum]